MARRLYRGAVVLAGVTALGVAAAAGYMAGAQRGEAPQTRLSLSTCGLVPAPAPIELPLATLMQKTGAPGLTLGPILHPGLDAPLSVVFVAMEPGGVPQPVQAGETLTLPLDIARLPDELRLSCRYGAVARVEYRRGPLRHAVDVAVIAAEPTPSAMIDPAPDGLPGPDAEPSAIAPREGSSPHG
jgi:hypothetical protein